VKSKSRSIRLLTCAYRFLHLDPIYQCFAKYMATKLHCSYALLAMTVELYLVVYNKQVLSQLSEPAQPARGLRPSLATPSLAAVQDAIRNMNGLSAEEVSQRPTAPSSSGSSSGSSGSSSYHTERSHQDHLTTQLAVVVVCQPVYTTPILCRRL
jgi:hypothetical protein